jgi:glycosyltransferase involved in cell wall biosynthesis
MRIGIIIARIGGEDGVALETEKWIDVLHEMGHEVFLLSGRYEKEILDRKHRSLCNEFYLLSRDSLKEQKQAFLDPDKKSLTILKHIEKKSEIISGKIIKWIKKKKINLLISENASALPFNLSMTFGVKKAVEKTGIKTITHDHDFYWERGNRYISFHNKINKIVRGCIPLRLHHVTNVVINSAMKKVLKEEHAIFDAEIIPNVMDFRKRIRCSKEKRRRFCKFFGFAKDDIILLQPTRIVRRKGIENAIELVYRLQDERVKLIITGSHKDEKIGDRYYEELISLVKQLDLSKQIIFAGKHMDKFSLFDFYSCCDACTYFSRYEGFGNAFVETILAKKPIFVNNYKPVFWKDIGSKGFRVVVIENNILTKKAINEIKCIIYDKEISKEIGEHNFELGKKYFSYDILREKLEKLI